MIFRRGRGHRALAALLGILLVLLAACGGGDDDGDGATPGEESDDFDPNAVLRVGFNLEGSSIGELDPTKTATPTNFDLTRYVFDTLLLDKGDGTYEPRLAERVEATGPSTVEIDLREGLKFSDGTPFDAEALKAGLQRNIDSKGRSFKGEFFRVSSIDVTSPTSVRVNLSEPVSGAWAILMAEGQSYIVSPKAVADGVNLSANPVGAGPFMVESYQPGVRLVLKKNPDYFQADEIKLAGVEFVNTASPESAQNALLAGEVDVLPNVPFQILGTFESNPDLNVVRGKPGAGWIKLDLCKSRPPFDDVRVRQALSLAIDRDAINEVLFQGEGEPVAGGFFPEGHPFYNEDVEEFHEYDVARAKKLLAEAGYPNGFSFEAFFSAGDTQRVMEIVQQQWRQNLNVNMEMAITTNLFNEFLQNTRRPMAGYTMQFQGMGKFTINTVTGQPNNACQYSDPELDKVARDLAAADQATPSQDAVDLWQEVAGIYYRDQLSINVLFTPVQAAMTKKVGDAPMLPKVSTGLPEPFMLEAFIRP